MFLIRRSALVAAMRSKSNKWLTTISTSVILPRLLALELIDRAAVMVLMLKSLDRCTARG